MKHLRYLLIFLIGFTILGFAQNGWRLDKAHSSVEFQAEHIVVINAKYSDDEDYPTVGVTDGKFNDFSVKFEQGEPDLTNSKVEAKISVNSVETGSAFRDSHLKSADFFDADKYPFITFKSTAFDKIDNNNFIMKGKLTIKGVTKEISLAVVLNAITGDESNYVSFTASGIIDRFDYGLRWSDLIENGGFRVSNYITIKLQANFVNDAKS